MKVCLLRISAENRTEADENYAAFGGADTTKGNTGPFWVASGLAVLSALVTFFFIRPLSHDGMIEEDEKVLQLNH